MTRLLILPLPFALVGGVVLVGNEIACSDWLFAVPLGVVVAAGLWAICPSGNRAGRASPRTSQASFGHSATIDYRGDAL
jgi:hypothetical protein